MSSKDKIPHIQIHESNESECREADINKTIEKLIEKIAEIERIGIEKFSSEEVENTLDMTDSLLTDCDVSQSFNFNRNENIMKLIYKYQKLSLKYESYKAEKNLKQIEKKQGKIAQDNEKIMQESHNLVYTILGFILSFSLISASVEAIKEIKSIEYICIFIIFMLILEVLVLLVLNNFHQNRGQDCRWLQSNHFILAVLFVILLFFFSYSFFKEYLIEFVNFYDKLDIEKSGVV